MPKDYDGGLQTNEPQPYTETEYDKEQRRAREKANRAAEKIAALIFADLDLEVSPHLIRTFIKSRWDRIAPLAHLVHEGPDMTKGPR